MSGPLDGIRIADFSWVGAGPFATKLLADHGADVIRIESHEHPDQLRSQRPFKPGGSSLNRSGYFGARNSSKRSFPLNMSKPQSRDIALSLIGNCDAVVNSFRPGIMERWGLDYQAIRTRYPNIIYLSLPLLPRESENAQYIGYGLTIAAWAGLTYLTAYEGEPPLGSGTNYPDHVPNPGHAAAALLAALYRRVRTGEGCEIEVSQVKSTLYTIAPALLQYGATGAEPPHVGNSAVNAVPHGVFPCRGADKWCAIAVTTDKEWDALVQAMLKPGWASRESYKLLEGRTSDRAMIEGQFASWTRTQDAGRLAQHLQEVGVPAAAVQDVEDVIADPQLQYRGYWLSLSDPELGTPILHQAAPFRLKGFERGPTRPAPLLGEHAWEVSRDLLSMDRATFEHLVDERVIY